jgi:hypothetical protein
MVTLQVLLPGLDNYPGSVARLNPRNLLSFGNLSDLQPLGKILGLWRPQIH